jgi:hypothetical protein
MGHSCSFVCLSISDAGGVMRHASRWIESHGLGPWYSALSRRTGVNEQDLLYMLYQLSCPINIVCKCTLTMKISLLSNRLLFCLKQALLRCRCYAKATRARDLERSGGSECTSTDRFTEALSPEHYRQRANRNPQHMHCLHAVDKAVKRYLCERDHTLECSNMS